MQEDNKFLVVENKWNKWSIVTIIVCFSLAFLGWGFLDLNHCLKLTNDSTITNCFSILSSVFTAGMIIMSAIQIGKSVDDEYFKNKPQLAIVMYSSLGMYMNPEDGKPVTDKNGKHNYSFCTNLGEKSRSFQFYGVCRKEDYPKIIIPKKKDKYGDLFWMNEQALKYVYPYLKCPISQPKLDFETLGPGEVSKHYKINLTDVEKELKKSNELEEFYVLYVDSAGYIFKELVRL